MERVSQQIANLQRRFQRGPLLFSAATGAAGLLLAVAIADYRRFKALGPGGVPYNVFGWLIVTLSIRPLSLSKRGSKSVEDFPATGASAEVLNLQNRKGPRPDVGEIIPQRQMDQNSNPAMRKVRYLSAMEDPANVLRDFKTFSTKSLNRTPLF